MIKATVQYFFISASTMIAHGVYGPEIANGSNGLVFDVSTSLDGSVNQIVQRLLTAIVVDADMRGLVLTESEILYPNVRRG